MNPGHFKASKDEEILKHKQSRYLIVDRSQQTTLKTLMQHHYDGSFPSKFLDE